MILYDDVTMILEAMDIDPVMGARDWVAGYHVEDALALAEAAFWSQARRPRWRSLVAGDPFARELSRWQDELMIEPASSTWDRPVKPSYFTWRPGPEYLVQKVVDFLNDRDRFPDTDVAVRWRDVKRGMPGGSGRTSSGCLRVLLECERGQVVTLTEVPAYHAYATPHQLKAELARHLFAALEVVVPKRWLGYGPERAPFFEAMSYVDALWGVEAHMN